MGNKKQEENNLSSDYLEKVKEDLEEIEPEIFTDNEIEVLKKTQNSISTDHMKLARLFLTGFDTLKNNILHIKRNEKLTKYLKQFDESEVRKILSEYSDGNMFGDHYLELRMKKIVESKRSKMVELINYFMKVLPE